MVHPQPLPHPEGDGKEVLLHSNPAQQENMLRAPQHEAGGREFRQESGVCGSSGGSDGFLRTTRHQILTARCHPHASC
ncbi:hypothetical protein GN956_G8380 [Arapaima gigas]